ncbi:thioredoxin-like protein [Lipomyces kononenkoae]|uniref:Thioredoxin-like protein n=1 Tax=Lipomyces kononenkoae TaxID=34357 RepID=A0ACC3TCM7_LIPKO
MYRRLICLCLCTYLLSYALAQSCEAPFPSHPDPSLEQAVLDSAPILSDNTSLTESDPFMLRAAARKMSNINIEIVSDPVCPWCYIGKKKLDQAIEEYQVENPDTTFTKTWKSFYVKPNSPLTGVTVLPHLAHQYGETMASVMTQRIRTMGADVGIDFKCEGKTGRTRDAHRVIQLAKLKHPELTTGIVQALFEAYWETSPGADITSHEDITKAGVKAGLDETEVREWLASDNGGKEADAEARALYISGVPNYKIGKYSVSGAQDSSSFVKIFNNIKAVENGEPEPWSWGSCVGQ